MSETKNHSAGQMSEAEFNSYYNINSKVKQKPELREQGIILSVRHLKQFFFFGKGPKRQKLKAVSNVSLASWERAAAARRPPDEALYVFTTLRRVRSITRASG